jgi:hypothetical protein
MRIPWRLAGALGLAALSLSPAHAADGKEPKKDKGPLLRYQHAYEAAVEEARNRGCVIFATFHIDH